jgi:Protein of unknown function (DUF664)
MAPWNDPAPGSTPDLAKGGLDQPVQLAHPDGRHANLRRLVCDLIEEYGRHTGHADLLREAVDGPVGEDPPAGWRPKSGHLASPADGHSPVQKAVPVSPLHVRNRQVSYELTPTMAKLISGWVSDC